MEDTKEWLYALDMSDNTICEIELDEKDNSLDTEDIFRRRNMNIENCMFMYSTERITKITHMTIN